MKTQLIWNPDFKNNALRKGILFLDWDLIIVLTLYLALFEIEIFMASSKKEKNIYIYISVTWNCSDVEICVRASIEVDIDEKFVVITMQHR